MIYISNLILPLIVLFILIYAIIKKVKVYDTFIEGTKESFQMILSLFPTLLAMIFAINILVNSGLLAFILDLLTPIINIINIPKDILPLAILRPISGSSSLALLNTILKTHGPDSITGMMSSVVQGATDTTIYIITLYYGIIGIKKIKHSLIAGLLADIIGIISAIIITKLIFNYWPN